MSELEKLRLAFRRDCIYTSDVLVEDFPDGSSMTRRIVCSDKISYLVVRLEPNDKSPLFPYFGRVDGLSRICDYFIFIEYADKVFVLLIELKRGYDNPIQQLDLSENFIKFVLRRMCLLQDLKLEKEFQVRKVGITDVRPPKQRTKVGDGLRYDMNNYIKRYKDSNIRIEDLTKFPMTVKNSGIISLAD